MDVDKYAPFTRSPLDAFRGKPSPASRKNQASLRYNPSCRSYKKPDENPSGKPSSVPHKNTEDKTNN